MLIRYCFYLVMVLGFHMAHSAPIVIPEAWQEEYKATKGDGFFELTFVNDEDYSQDVSVHISVETESGDYTSGGGMDVDANTTVTFAVRRPFISHVAYWPGNNYRATNLEKREKIISTGILLVNISRRKRTKLSIPHAGGNNYVGDTLFVNIGDARYPYR